MTTFQNNGKLKLLIIVGTRPEIIRLAAVINRCREYFDCILAHTGQNRRQTESHPSSLEDGRGAKEEGDKSITEGLNFGKLSCHIPSIRDKNLEVTTAKIMSDKLWHNLRHK